MRFTIHGNQEDKLGNPIGYNRTTQGSYWNERSRRYKAWKDFVIKNFCEQTGVKDTGYKPIKDKGRHHMKLQIFFKDKTHGDPDNIFKGVADSLFVSDKYLSGEFYFDYDKLSPRIEVFIEKCDNN